MKTRLLFVIESLHCGGAEKSLTTLLSLLDYNTYDVSLQLFSYDGEFMRYIPSQVKLLPLLPSSQVEQMSIIQQVLKCKYKTAWAHLRFSFQVRQHKCQDSNDVFMRYWENYGSLITCNPQNYDVAIAYGQRLPTFYVAYKVHAVKKIAWINIIPQLNICNQNFQKPIYNSFHKIVCVSEASRQQSIKLFELPETKTDVITDIIDSNIINRLSEEIPQFSIDKSRPVLLTVARLDYACKGYDIALEASKILLKRGVDFTWYAIGKGEKRNEMLQYIKANGLERHFILLGAMPNPYPYFKMCDIYVQPSRYEGYGISIAEARLLNRPVVCCEFGSVWKQMIQGKNGIVTKIDAKSLANAIEDLLKDRLKYQAIQEYQRTEKKGNIEEIERINKLFRE